MTQKFLLPAALAATMAVSGLAFAQTSTNQPDGTGQPASKQSAPANAPDAQGHDAQTGKPASGEAIQEKTDAMRDKSAIRDQDGKAKGDKK
ncbi:MAG: hypothetical protein J0G95_11070 [Rhizobiales bacterium]|jgi:hypothetical protein|nr:hypothetical protein [Hyphomicrobiales bacterium]